MNLLLTTDVSLITKTIKPEDTTYDNVAPKIENLPNISAFIKTYLRIHKEEKKLSKIGLAEVRLVSVPFTIGCINI